MTPSTLIDRPAVAAPVWGSLVAAGPLLWRVQERRGRILGHLRAVRDASSEAVHYRAERFDAVRGRFRTVGEFRSADDAMQSLRS